MNEISDAFISWTLRAFDRGETTTDMAKLWFEHIEADFERALHIGLERRRAERRKADEQAERLADKLGANV